METSSILPPFTAFDYRHDPLSSSQQQPTTANPLTMAPATLVLPTINPQLKIAVLNGGTSAEAEVSRVSARGVIAALRVNYDQVFDISLDGDFAAELSACKPDVVFPVVHGSPGEDGTLQGFLEMLGYAYVGSDVHSSAIAMDKIIAKHVFRAAGLPLIEQVVVEQHQGISAASELILSELGSYVVVKPARQGSALGVTLVDNASQLHEALATAFKLDPRLLIERRVDGKEITVGVIDVNGDVNGDVNDQTLPFPVIEIATPDNTFYDYAHRYTVGLSEHLMPAPLTPAQTERLQAIAIAAHRSLGCRDLSRADFVVPNDDEEYLLEVNTLPGMTPTSLYPDGASGFGLTFAELTSYLVERAAAR
ncbi:MAG: D-alanine-D-alanine ligase [Cyclobacteriaceae bacterium]|jgi:D-alanine-D-alanine ligase